MTVATGLDFMGSGVKRFIKTCCCGIWRGEALAKKHWMFWMAGCLLLGLDLGELTAFWHCLPLHEYYGEIALKAVPEVRCWDCPEGVFFFKKNV